MTIIGTISHNSPYTNFVDPPQFCCNTNSQ